MKKTLQQSKTPIEIELEGKLGPLSARVKGVMKRSRMTPDLVIAARFASVVYDQGISLNLLPRLFPEIKYTDVATLNTLAAALTPKLVDTCATLFGVRASWIEGNSEEIYDRNWCYKSPKRFIEHLRALDSNLSDYPVRFLIDSKLDPVGRPRQNLALIVQEKVMQLSDDIEVYRYHIYGDSWDWTHAPCRLQLKAMCRWVYKTYGKPIPIYSASQKEVELVQSGNIVPHQLISGCVLTEPSMEDFCLLKEESLIAKETEELPLIFEYILKHDLDPNGKIHMVCSEPVWDKK